MAFAFTDTGRQTITIRDAAFDGRSRTELLGEPLPESLIGQNGRTYTAFFDGHQVWLSGGEGVSVGRWVLGTAPVRVRGGGRLDARFVFTFFDHGATAQRLNALWTFAGSNDEAFGAFIAARFRRSTHDERWNSGAARRRHLRTAGSVLTGADSAHAILDEGVGDLASGEIHVGEHNPLRGFGIGFLLHQWELRRRRESLARGQACHRR